MVKIYVGSERQCWVLHEDALCHYSEYTKKAFQGHFAEADQKTLTLEEDDSIIFGHFVDWVYTGSVACTLNSSKPHKIQPKEHFLLYIRLMIFADKYLMPALSQSAVVEWEKCHSRDDPVRPFVEEVKLIFEDCPEKSDLRVSVVGEVLKYYLQSGAEKDFAYMGQVLSCNVSFAEDFSRELSIHYDLGPFSCEVCHCSVHEEVAQVSSSAKKRQRLS